MKRVNKVVDLTGAGEIDFERISGEKRNSYGMMGQYEDPVFFVRVTLAQWRHLLTLAAQGPASVEADLLLPDRPMVDGVRILRPGEEPDERS